MRQAAAGGAQFVLTPEMTNALTSNKAHLAAIARDEASDETLAALRAEAAAAGLWLLVGSLGLIRLPDDGPAALLRDLAFLQIALNVLLFVPLGYFVRVVLHRGVLVATALGLGVSLLIEVTQRTGVWNLYDCAYRLFDVDDL